MADYLFAIPSYDRVEQLRHKTLALLKRHKISPKKIYIFVSADQFEMYSKEFPAYNVIGTKAKGILNTRNVMTKYFKEGQKLVHMDDDIEEVLENKGTKTKGNLQPIDLKKFIRKAFSDIKKLGLSMWGVNPVANPFFMSDNVSVDLRYTVAAFRGVINHHDIILKGYDQKEDVENSIRAYIRDGGILRYNNITLKTRWYAPGGIVATVGSKEERLKKSKEAVDWLVKEFPEYGKAKQRKNGIWEFVLKKNPVV